MSESSKNILMKLSGSSKNRSLSFSVIKLKIFILQFKQRLGNINEFIRFGMLD
jgi:hypothetical protein